MSSETTPRKLGRGVLCWGFVVILAIVHFDFWAWSDRSLVMGFMPSGLLYQALISLAAGICWFLVVKFAWPDRIEAWADESIAGDDGASE